MTVLQEMTVAELIYPLIKISKTGEIDLLKLTKAWIQGESTPVLKGLMQTLWSRLGTCQHKGLL